MKHGIPFSALGALLITNATAGVNAPDYAGEVSSILAAHCTTCHRAGQLGRIALDSYEQAKAFAAEIREAVGTRKMPPWPAVPEFGELQHDRSLSVRDIETLIRWTDSGMPRGVGLPARPIETARVKGKPGLVLEPESAYRVPSTGKVECRCFAIRTGLPEARTVRGIDVNPGDPRLVHHVRVFVDFDKRARKLDAADPEGGFDCSLDTSLTRTSLGEWSAGQPPNELPEGAGRLLPANADMVVEIRYGRLGYAVFDRTRINLYFQERPGSEIVRTKVVVNDKLNIPAGQWNYLAEAEWIADRDLTLLSFSPIIDRHGNDCKVVCVLPDGTIKPLVWVRDYDQNWQMAYFPKNPLRIPKGSRVKVTASFDNAASKEPAGGVVGVILEYL